LEADLELFFLAREDALEEVLESCEVLDVRELERSMAELERIVDTPSGRGVLSARVRSSLASPRPSIVRPMMLEEYLCGLLEDPLRDLPCFGVTARFRFAAVSVDPSRGVEPECFVAFRTGLEEVLRGLDEARALVAFWGKLLCSAGARVVPSSSGAPTGLSVPEPLAGASAARRTSPCRAMMSASAFSASSFSDITLSFAPAARGIPGGREMVSTCTAGQRV